MRRPVIVVHGGATSFKESDHPAILEAVRRASSKGYAVMLERGTALEAVEAAVWVMEDSGLFTAGRGAAPNAEGFVELDAIIMDGNRLESGAVMAVRGITHPISLARYVLERTPNMQFVADGAIRLYEKMVREGYREEVAPGVTGMTPLAEGCDTVGAVAVDLYGRLASAASTSGWTGKLPGRVGDTPIVGAGVYANEVAAACCTGRGEQILRITMARMAVHYVEEGSTVRDATHNIMRVLRDRTTGEAGLIMVDSQGDVGIGFDTPYLPVGVMAGDLDEPWVSMRPSWPSG